MLYFVFCTWDAYKNRNLISIILFAIMTVIHNVLLPIHLHKLIWIEINTATIILILTYIKYYNLINKK